MTAAPGVGGKASRRSSTRRTGNRRLRLLRQRYPDDEPSRGGAGRIVGRVGRG